MYMQTEFYDMSGKLDDLVKLHGEPLGTLAYARMMSRGPKQNEIYRAESGEWMQFPGASAAIRRDKLLQIAANEVVLKKMLNKI
jgi:hypothetical protein